MDKCSINTNEKSICCGCGNCGYICPTHAISLDFDEEGFVCPIIDDSLCIKCGQCLNHCPIQSDIDQALLHPIGKHYAVINKDSSIQKQSRSGGAFVALSDVILSQSGYVFGAINDNNTIKHIGTNKLKQRDMMCGSKYVQSDISETFNDLSIILNSGLPVLFCGTPCQVASIANLFNPQEYKNLILCDFLCHGVPSPGFFNSYISWLESVYENRIIEYDFRDKSKYSWQSHIEKITFSNSKTIYSKRFSQLFAKSLILRESCYSCPFATEERISDLTLGDYWGFNNTINGNMRNGVSLVIVRSDKGEMLFDQAKEKCNWIDTTDTVLTHYNLYRPTNRPVDRDKFWLDYQRFGFEHVSNKYGTYDFLHRIKYYVIDGIR